MREREAKAEFTSNRCHEHDNFKMYLGCPTCGNLVWRSKPVKKDKFRCTQKASVNGEKAEPCGKPFSLFTGTVLQGVQKYVKYYEVSQYFIERPFEEFDKRKLYEHLKLGKDYSQLSRETRRYISAIFAAMKPAPSTTKHATYFVTTDNRLLYAFELKEGPNLLIKSMRIAESATTLIEYYPQSDTTFVPIPLTTAEDTTNVIKSKLNKVVPTTAILPTPKEPILRKYQNIIHTEYAELDPAKWNQRYEQLQNPEHEAIQLMFYRHIELTHKNDLAQNAFKTLLSGLATLEKFRNYKLYNSSWRNLDYWTKDGIDRP